MPVLIFIKRLLLRHTEDRVRALGLYLKHRGELDEELRGVEDPLVRLCLWMRRRVNTLIELWLRWVELRVILLK